MIFSVFSLKQLLFSIFSVLCAFFFFCIVATTTNAGVISLVPANLDVGTFGFDTNVMRSVKFSRLDDSTEEFFTISLQDESGAIELLDENSFSLLPGEKEKIVEFRITSKDVLPGNYSSTIGVGQKTEKDSSSESMLTAFSAISAHIQFSIISEEVVKLSEVSSKDVEHLLTLSKKKIAPKENIDIDFSINNNTSKNIRDISYYYSIYHDDRLIDHHKIQNDELLMKNAQMHDTIPFHGYSEGEYNVIVESCCDEQPQVLVEQHFQIQSSKPFFQNSMFIALAVIVLVGTCIIGVVIFRKR